MNALPSLRPQKMLHTTLNEECRNVWHLAQGYTGIRLENCMALKDEDDMRTASTPFHAL